MSLTLIEHSNDLCTVMRSSENTLSLLCKHENLLGMAFENATALEGHSLTAPATYAGKDGNYLIQASHIKTNQITSISLPKMLELVSNLIKYTRLYVTKRSHSIVVEPYFVKSGGMLKIHFIPTSAKSYSKFASADEIEEFIKAVAANVLNTIKNLFSYKKVNKPSFLDGISGFTLDEMQFYFEWLSLGYEVSGIFPVAVPEREKLSTVAFLGPFAFKIKRYFEFCQRINKGAKGYIRIWAQDKLAASEITKCLKLWTYSSGCDVLNSSNMNKKKSLNSPCISFTDRFNLVEIQNLFEAADSIGIVFLDYSNQRTDLDVYGINQYNYVSFPTIKLESYTADCVEKVISGMFNIHSARAKALSIKLFDATLGQYTLLYYLIQILISEKQLFFNIQRQRWDFSEDLEIDRAQLVIKKLRNLSAAEREILVALILHNGAIPNGMLNQVLTLRSDEFYNALDSLKSKNLIERGSDSTRVINQALRAALRDALSPELVTNYRKRFRAIHSKKNNNILETIYFSTDDDLATMDSDLYSVVAKALQGYLQVDRHIVRSSIDRVNEIVSDADWRIHRVDIIRYCNAVSEIEKEWGNLKALSEIYTNYIVNDIAPIQRSRVLSNYLDVLKKYQRYEEALDVGLKWLKLLKVNIDISPTKTILAIDYFKTALLLRLKGEWVRTGQLKFAINPDDMEINRVIGQLGGAAYMGSPPVFALLCFLAMRRVVAHGVTAENAFGIAGYACCESQLGFGGRLSLPRNLNKASAYLGTARAVVAKFDGQFENRIDLLEYGFLNNWRESPSKSIDKLKKTYSESNKNQDTEYALYTGAVSSILAFTNGGPLSDVLTLSRLPYIQSIESGQSTTTNNISLLFQLVGTLNGETMNVPNNIMNLDCHWKAEFNRQEDYGRFDQTTKIVFLTFQLFKSVWSNSISFDTYELLSASRQCLDGLQGQQITVLYAFLECILFAEKPDNKRNKKRFNRNYKLFEKLVKESKSNYEAYWFFLRGLKFKSQNQDYVSFWEQAHEMAVKHKQWHIAGYFSERISRVFISSGNQSKARDYLKSAADAYDSWQAYELSNKIRKAHALIFQSELPPPTIVQRETDFLPILNDFLSIKATYQSGERYIENLLKVMLSKLPLRNISIFQINLYGDVNVSKIDTSTPNVYHRKISQNDLTSDQKTLLFDGGTKNSINHENHVFSYSLLNESCFAFIELVGTSTQTYTEDPLFETVLSFFSAGIKDNYQTALLDLKDSSMQSTIELSNRGVVNALIADAEEKLKSIDVLSDTLKRKYSLDFQDKIVIEQATSNATSMLKKIDSTATFFENLSQKSLETLKESQVLIVADQTVSQVEIEILKAVVKTLSVISYADLFMRAAQDLTPTTVMWTHTDTDLVRIKNCSLYSAECSHYAVGTVAFSKRLGLPKAFCLSTILDFVKIQNDAIEEQKIRVIHSPTKKREFHES